MQESLSVKSMTQTKRFVKVMPFVVCFLAAAFYLYEFILQASIAILTQDLMRDLQIHATGVGIIGAFFYIAYAGMQIPAGLLYDRFSVRILLTTAVVVCASGAFLFVVSNSATLVACGRFLMGIGSAFSFIGSLVLVSRWFPATYFALIAGVVQLMSSIGAILGGRPLAGLVTDIGWRSSLTWLGFIGLLLALLIWMVVRDYPAGHKALTESDNVKFPNHKVKKQSWWTLIKTEFKRLNFIVHDGQTRYVAIYAFLTWAPMASFSLLWGVAYLMTRYSIGEIQASGMMMFIWIGVGFGSPFIGWLSNHLGSRCQPMRIASSIGVVAALFILYVPLIPMSLMIFVLFLFGLASSGQSLSFAVVNDITPRDYVGTAIGFNNMAVVLGGLLFQPLIGWLLHIMWQGDLANGAPVYTIANYRAAFFLLPLCHAGALIVSRFFIRETKCHTMHPH